MTRRELLTNRDLQRYLIEHSELSEVDCFTSSRQELLEEVLRIQRILLKRKSKD